MQYYGMKISSKRGVCTVVPEVKYKDWELLLAESSLSSPVLKIISGTKLDALIKFKDPFNFLLSKKIVEKLDDYGLTGWSTYKVTIPTVSDEFYGFQITGRSNFIKKPDKGMVTGIRFNQESWDKSDFFVPEGTAFKLCTERAKEALIALKIPKIEFVEARDYRYFNG